MDEKIDLSWIPERDRAYLGLCLEAADGSDSTFLKNLKFHTLARLDEIEAHLSAEYQILRESMLIAVDQVQNMRLSSLEKEIFNLSNPKKETWADLGSDVATAVLVIAVTTVATEALIATVSYTLARSMSKNLMYYKKLQQEAPKAYDELMALNSKLKAAKTQLSRDGVTAQMIRKSDRVQELMAMQEKYKVLSQSPAYRAVMGSSMPDGLKEFQSKADFLDPDVSLLKKIFPSEEVVKREIRNVSKESVNLMSQNITKWISSGKTKEFVSEESLVTPANTYLSSLLEAETNAKYKLGLERSSVMMLEDMKEIDKSIIPSILSEAEAYTNGNGISSMWSTQHQAIIRLTLVQSFELYFWLNHFNANDYFVSYEKKYSVTKPREFTPRRTPLPNTIKEYFNRGIIVGMPDGDLLKHSTKTRITTDFIEGFGAHTQEEITKGYTFKGVSLLSDALAFNILDRHSDTLASVLVSKKAEDVQALMDELKTIEGMPVNNSKLGIPDVTTNYERIAAIEALKALIIYCFAEKYKSLMKDLNGLSDKVFKEINNEQVSAPPIPNTEEKNDSFLETDPNISKIEDLIENLNTAITEFESELDYNTPSVMYEPMFPEQPPIDWSNRVQQDLKLANTRLSQLPIPSIEMQQIYEKKIAELDFQLKEIDARIKKILD